MSASLLKSVLFWGIFILVLFHVVGAVGLANDRLMPFFVRLTPVHILLATILLFLFHKDWNASFVLFLILTYSIGFFVEVLGIQTKAVFGNYAYTYVLGPRLWDTPLIIGINWLMLIYAAGITSGHLAKNIHVKVIIATALMLILDFFIEPVAISLNFWQWEKGSIPIQNYFAWSIVSLVLLYVFYLLPFSKSNRIASTFYLIQLFFFIVLNLALRPNILFN